MKTRNVGLDILRVMIMFMIVMIHAPFRKDVAMPDWASTIINSANAMFALLAGWFMVLPQGGEALPWLKRRTYRLLVPYLIWELFYIVLQFGFDAARGAWRVPTTGEAFNMVFFVGASTQLWFIITLFYVQCGFVVFACASSMILKSWDRGSKIARYGMMCGALIVARFFHHQTDREWVNCILFMTQYVSLGWLLRCMVGCVRWQLPTFGRWILLTICLAVSLSGLGLWPMVRAGLLFVAFAMLPVGRLSFAEKAAGWTMGIYLCHFLFTRSELLILSKLDLRLTSFFELVLVTALAFAASAILFILTKRCSIIWGIAEKNR